MQVIYKYRITDNMEMPKDAQIIRVGEQDGELVLWAIVTVGSSNVRRYIYVIGTGRETDFDLRAATYHGTVQQSNGLVWHIFEGR